MRLNCQAKYKIKMNDEPTEFKGVKHTFLVGWEAHFNGDDQCQAFIATRNIQLIPNVRSPENG